MLPPMVRQHPDAVTAARAVPLDLIDLSAGAVWRREIDRYELFRRLRDEHPVSFHREAQIDGFPHGPGFWAVTRFADVRAVSRDPETFCNGQGYLVVDLPTELGEFYGSMLHMDAPRHTRMRLIVNRSFTPRHVARIEQYVDDKAASIVARARELGEFDFVEEIAAALPLEVICQMMGIPESLWPTVLRCTNGILGASDAEYGGSFDELLAVSLEIAALAEEIAKDRLANPGDDLTSALMHAEVDGHRLTTAEYASFFILLVVAGNETTRNATTHGVWQLALDPAQRTRWQADVDGLMPTAIEEIVRYSSPVQMFRRTATRDTEIGGQPIAAGEKVVLHFSSANRDERAFPAPDRFDIGRTPNDHLGFGAGGPHFCLGANLARRELRAIFAQLLTALPTLEVTGEPDYLDSAFINGIKHLPVRVR
jgi:cytochrome P450